MKQYSDSNFQHTYGVENRSTPDPATWFSNPANIFEEPTIKDQSNFIRSIRILSQNERTPRDSLYNTGYLDYLQNYSLFSMKKSTKLQKKTKIHDIKDGYNSSIAYQNFLDGLKGDLVIPSEIRYKRPERCGKFGKLYNCSEHEYNYLYDPKLCGERRLCVICGNQYSMTRGMQIMELFNVVSDTYPQSKCINVTFTVPDQVRRILGFGNIKRFVACSIKTMNDFYQGLMPGGVVIAHTWYSSEPLKGWYPHIHSMWSNYAYDKQAERFVKIDHFLTADQLDQFKEIWRSNLIKEFPECKIPKAINLYWEYIPVNKYTRSRVFHRIKYNTRLPQLDITQYSNDKGILEYTPQEKTVVDNQIKPPRNWRRIRWVGWCSDRNKQRIWGMHHPSKPLRSNKQIRIDEGLTSTPRCDVCYKELTFLDYYTIEDLNQERIPYQVNPEFKYAVTVEKGSDH